MSFALLLRLHLNAFCVQLQFERTIGNDVGFWNVVRVLIEKVAHIYAVIVRIDISYLMKLTMRDLYSSIFVEETMQFKCK